ncbi:MAG TPA: hypothetical protein VL460_03205 [Caulobacteraceae bacterium]|nr:hypothetical protein [Caulobacteraceae bacterium]
MKLNMGCGHNRLEGYVNVDLSPACAPDQVVDLERTPWPWETGSAEAVLFNHSLEHIGGDPRVFLAIMQELYRVCAAGAVVDIRVPHPRHDNFIGDPTHVRIISPQVLSLFDRALNDEWKRTGAPNTPLAHYTGVDFVIAEAQTVIAEPYRSRYHAGELTQGQVAEALRTSNNVAEAFHIKLTVRK